MNLKSIVLDSNANFRLIPASLANITLEKLQLPFNALPALAESNSLKNIRTKILEFGFEAEEKNVSSIPSCIGQIGFVESISFHGFQLENLPD